MNCREKTIGRLFIWSATDGTRFYLMRTTVLKTQQSAPPGGPSNCFWGSLREVLESASHFGGLGPHALAWTRRKAPTHIVHFEVLIGNPGKELDRAIDALAQGASLSVMRRCPLFKSGTTQCRGSFERERLGPGAKKCLGGCRICSGGIIAKQWKRLVMPLPDAV